MFRKKIIVSQLALVMFLSLILSLWMAGCGAPISKDGFEAEAPKAALADSVASQEIYLSSSIAGEQGSGEESKGLEYPATEAAEGGGKQYIIRNAVLTLELEDLEEASTEIQLIADQLGGYIASREFYDLMQERRGGHISLRIPEDKFLDALHQLKELGKAKNEHIYSDDVTRSYIDLEARLKNLTVQEQRIRALLERAESIAEILEIEKELGRLRGDLEAMTAEFKYLQERVLFSTIDLHLQEKDPRSQVVGDGFGNFGEKVGDLLALNTNRFLTGTSSFLILMIGSLPLLIPILFLLFVGWRLALVRAKRREKEEHSNKKNGLSQ